MSTSITVRFVGGLRSTVGKDKIKLNINGERTLRELINMIVERFPETKKTFIDPELGDPRPNALIIVNDREISVLNGLETIIKEGDEVIFVPVSHGG
ncbi:MAG: MoaD/ThiS family protein [Candidatus Bathyarchaeota archaeon]|nr:MoaD/ThiS family protein [Candidatus Bathyarchaeota archaeon]MDW8040258.1 MoaD/ThiS family protein [Nitrososphaerota archaeon]